MKATEFIALLNEASVVNGFFTGAGENGGVYSTILTEDGKRHFVNRVRKYASIDENGMPVPALDADGKEIWTYALGKEMVKKA